MNKRRRGRPRNARRISLAEKPVRSEYILIEPSDGKGISAKVFKQQAV